MVYHFTIAVHNNNLYNNAIDVDEIFKYKGISKYYYRMGNVNLGLSLLSGSLYYYYRSKYNNINKNEKSILLNNIYIDISHNKLGLASGF